MAFGLNAELEATLRSLRQRRGLGLEEASRLSGVSKAAISAWENGTRRPRGLALARLLNALGADPRTKARLLHLADPGQARIELDDSPFGAPVDVGTILRLVRGQRGIAQADLSRSLGVSQATVSRWETGDDVPSSEALSALGTALCASAEEILALESAAESGNAGLSHDPEVVLEEIRSYVPAKLRELTLLAWEAELWRRATRDSRWDTCLVAVIAARACLLVAQERYAEVSPLAERAMGLAATTEGRLQAVPAIGSLAFADHRLGKGSRRAVDMAEEWGARLPDSSAKAWMLRQRGMGLLRIGRVDEGIEWVVRSSEMDLESKPDHPEPWSHHAEMLVEAHLAVGDATRAAAVVGGRRERLFPSHLFVQIEHALGRAVSEAEMAYLRFHTHNVDRSRLAQRRLDGIERRQASLTGNLPQRTEPIADAEIGETERRLWSSVLRQHPG